MPLTPEQTEELQEAFNMFDKSKKGSIAASDLGPVMSALGQNMSEVELKEMSGELGAEVSFKAFCDNIAKKLEGPSNAADVKAAFAVFDKDKSGNVSAAQLKKILTELGEQLSSDEVDAMLKTADVDGSGNINYENFMKKMLSA
mmetsp:Transcript_19732/g.42496  ORF Transcript_19732/g.42496 Transcript_19732/m.42496 type:complete len:144 (-) Transcript_19732:31-462(-)|eukprot:CAMPEP_0183377176 /NCGR_PEP_ID=MMETSP0164_2-20130417/122344_1 /TAXON_ID=221442 /ORGANISM="Coccolithus pelagicus ssp braarudi, Strain PLY182g" /LENGTH=143 /DNA_ID=CAMNT_0025554599 /DNA_START=49 /DNA_END=480 /DNA_ORIENTATION=-